MEQHEIIDVGSRTYNAVWRILKNHTNLGDNDISEIAADAQTRLKDRLQDHAADPRPAMTV